ncbi:Ger(x)C family spore germination protein [Neobacillus mesonae]|uniref:Ger(x)C family spore germination protein n=1 Tax=Neobacillus mesonae TaxID=1193713 RepID=UPI0008330244|nr:Ger(x)C family spore germination protein [Neobacillus mesonae]
MRKNKLWLWLFILLLLSGCAKPKTLEQIGMVTTKGYDIGNDGIIKGTMVVLMIDPSAQQKTGVMTAKALTARGIRIKGDLFSSKKLLSGQLRVVLFSEALGRHGIKPFTDTLVRDPSISDLTYLAIVEGETEEMLRINNKQIPDVGQHIFKLIDHNVKWSIVPSSTLHETLHGNYSVGIDPVLPILKKSDNEVKVSGLALLKDNKMVGKVSETKSYYLKTIRSPIKSGEFEIPISGHSLSLDNNHLAHKQLAVTLDTVFSKAKIKLINQKKLEFDLKLKINARMQEINTDVNLRKPKTVQLLEKEIANQMKKDIEQLIAYCQSVDSDPIGLGEEYRSSVRHSKLTREKWHKMFPDAKVNVKVDFTLVKTGLVE